jgi:hypothetical protein
MTAAGDAVLSVALGEVGYTEDPPGSNNTKYWDWYGANLGSWCAVFVSWCCEMAGYPMCAIDSSKGFVLVSNGTVHSYQHYEEAIEAQRTLELQPGDVVLFSWYSWDWDGTPGAGGVPIITDPEWAGWVAGDHTGIVAVPPNADGYFDTVEGNTSQSSWDNGGAVLYRTDRHISQVCGWWRPRNYGEASSNPITPPTPSIPPLTGLGMFLLANDQRGIWLMGPGYAYGLNPEEFSQVAGIPGIQTFQCGNNERAFDVIYQSCMNGVTAVEN